MTVSSEQRRAHAQGTRTDRGHGSSPTVTTEELRQLLRQRGSFPDDFRPIAWRILLELPCNVEAHQALMALGRHPALADLNRAFPLPGKAGVRLTRALTALLHWAPILADVPYLPALVFPVTQVFGANEVLTFEFVATFFFSWGRDWLEFFPGPPLGMLQRAATLLEATDPELFAHIVECSGCSCARFSFALVWPVFQTLMSEVLTRNDWLCMWDALVARCSIPDLLEAVCVVLLCHRRAALLGVPKGQPHGIDAELRRPRTKLGPTSKIIREAQHLLKTSCAALQADATKIGSRQAPPGLPLPRALTYPMLPSPTVVIDFSQNETERLIAEHKALCAEDPASRLSRIQMRIDAIQSKLQEQQSYMSPNKRVTGVNSDTSMSMAHVAQRSDRRPLREIQRRGIVHQLAAERDDVTDDILPIWSDSDCSSAENDAAMARQLPLHKRQDDREVVYVGDAIVMREPEMGRLKMFMP